MYKKDTICWNCINAVPNPKKGIGCEWLCKGKEVPGWEAIPRWQGDTVYSYKVLTCPKFVRG